MLVYNSGENEYKNFLLKEDSFDPNNLGKTESIMCQGNGYICVRGYSEESYPNKTANTFIAGTFNVTNENEVTELPNTADTFSFDIFIDGERFFLTKNNVENYSKTLNLRTGELKRTFTYKTLDNELSFVMTRFISSDNLHLLASRTEIISLKKDCEIKINSGINSRCSNSGESHFHYVSGRFFDKKYIYTNLKTTQSGYDFYINVCHRAFANGVEDLTLPKPVMERRKVTQTYTFEGKKDSKITFEKYASYYTCVDNKEIGISDMENSYKLLVEYAEKGYDKLFLESKTALEEKLWKNDYIEVSSENEFDQFAVNYVMYHLNVMTPSHDARMNIGAKGLSGEGYKGHTFWDTEVFILPRYILQNPTVAKSLMTYRYKGLAGAKKKALESGFKGAMFPWEGANPDDGEVTPVYNNMDPFTGEREVVKTGMWEIHITSDVAFGIYSYYKFTGDIEFMKKYGYEILLETAIFWNSRLETSENDDLLHINGVIGPDEYSEYVNDNAYTNYLAKWNMEYAVEIFNELKNNDNELFNILCEKTGIDKEIEDIKARIEKVYIPKPDENLIIDQDTTFRNLEEIDLERYKNADKVGLILEEYNLEQVSEFKVSKQADIMVLFLLFGEKWDNATKKANFDYYEPFCLHDSSLSFSTYSILANDIGDTDYSYKLFNKACLIDLTQKMNSSDAGIHSASYGGVWQCIVYGFAGIRMIGNELHITPKFPKEINNLKFNFYYQGQKLSANISKNNISILNNGDKKVEIFFNGNGTEVSPKTTLEVTYEKA